MRKFSDLLFEIQGKPGSKSKLVHHDRLKSYHADVLPDWLHLKTGSFPKKTNECKTKKQATKTPRFSHEKGTSKATVSSKEDLKPKKKLQK